MPTNHAPDASRRPHPARAARRRPPLPALASTGTELRRFRGGVLPTVAIAALVVIPLLYGALYLWAFWDPTGRMDRLPVALVDADVATTLDDGTPVHAGAEVAERLLDDGRLDWVLTDAADAASGVSDGTYYFSLTLPPDFSAAIASAGGDDPRRARLEVSYNDANSFLADTLGHSAMVAVDDAVRTTIGQEAVQTLLVGVSTTRDGIVTAAEGAVTLESATTQLTAGAAQVASGADQAADGATRLATGAGTAASGAARLTTGARTAADGAGRLATGSATLASGLEQAAEGSTTLRDGAGRLAAGVDQAAAQVTATAQQLSTAGPALADVAAYLQTRVQAGDAAAARPLAEIAAVSQGLGAVDPAGLAQDLGALRTGASDVAAGTTALATALQSLEDGATTVAGGAATLADGTAQLADGAGSLADGTADLANGASALADGTSTLAAGAHEVADGGSRLAEGAGTLAQGLTDGAAALPDDDASATAARSEVVSTPVTLDEQHVVRAEGFGEGFAPFFVSLALFVGALITWLLLRPLPTRALAGPVGGFRIAFAGYLPAALLALAQVVVMMAVLGFGLGLDMSTVVGTVAFTALTALAFVALQQMLTALLGSAAGKVTILALLMLQLASSGGTYPVETTPAFFRAIHPFLPMTYSVTGLREVITGGADGRLWSSVAVLVGVLVGSLAVTAWRAARMRTWTLARLHPVLAI